MHQGILRMAETTTERECAPLLLAVKQMKCQLQVNVYKNSFYFNSSYRKNTYKKYYGTATSTATTT
jgi:hypothetical protein